MLTPMEAFVEHRFDLSIEPQDIDFLGHVNNATYLTWVQKAVLSHWAKHAPPDAIAAYVWVAVKHEIVYRRPAFLRDRLAAVVRLEKVQRESAFYETAICRGDDVLAEIKSRWCCLDAATRRPIRLSREVADRFLVSAAYLEHGEVTG